MSAHSRLTLSIMAVVAVMLGGTAGYMVIDDVGFVDALFMVVITISTVGYEEVWPLSSSGRLWTIGIIAFGIITVSFAFTSLVRVVVSGELRSVRERKKMDRTINSLKNHVVLCGYGRMGALATEELVARGVSVVIVELDAAREAELREANLPYVIGDATDEDVLMRAGFMHCKSLVLATPSDADNVYITLTAHTLCPTVEIVARAEHPTTEPKLIRAGASRVVCPQVTGAARVANIITRPTVVDFVELAGKGVDLEIDEYHLRERSPLVGRSLAEADVRRHTGAMVVAIKRVDGEALVSPGPDAVLSAGDTLILVGPAGMSDRLDALEG